MDSAPELAVTALQQELASFNQLTARIIDVRYFGDLNGNASATVPGVSLQTVERGSRQAKWWLAREVISGENASALAGRTSRS